MKVLVTTHAQMFQTPDGKVWTSSVYGYDFFKRYLNVFNTVRLVTRMKKISFEENKNKILVSGPNLEFYALPFYHGPWEYAKNFFRIKKELSKAIDSCDRAILRIPDQVSFSLFKKLKQKNIPCAIEVVAHSWDLYAPGTIKTILRPFLRLIWDSNQKKICKNAEGVSYVTTEYIQKRYPSGIKKDDSKRFETTYTSADLNYSFFKKPRNKESFGKKNLNFIMVSGINNTSKGHNELLKIMSELKSEGYRHKLTIVGGGSLLDEFKQKSKDLEIDDLVDFTGQLEKPEEIAKQLESADIFVLSSLSEGLPRVLLEAMSSGLPCIATDVGGVSELISKDFLVPPRNVLSLKEKIIELSNNKNKLADESQKNYNKIQMHYKPEIIKNRRNKYYNKLKDISN